MEDIELDDQIDEDYIEDSSYQACFVYRSTVKRNISSGQPNKKTKRNHDVQTHAYLPRLFAPDGSHVVVDRRKHCLESILLQQQIQDYENGPDKDKISQLLSFIGSPAASATDARLPTALLLTGLDKAASEAVLQATSERFVRSKSCIFISLQSRQCSNLQHALKNLIKAAIVQHSGLETYNDFLTKNKKFHPLNFDLELLELFIREKHVTKIVVSLSDMEDVEASTASDLINNLQLWQKRIQSVLLLGITSTRELFEHRLSKSCLKHLNARTFDFTPCTDHISSLLRVVQTSAPADSETPRVFLGPSVMKTLGDLSQGQGDNAQSLEANLRYLLLSHFVAHPVSALADTVVAAQTSGDDKILANIARKTVSFKRFCESVVTGQTTAPGANLTSLLEDDAATLTEVGRRVKEGMNAYSSMSNLIYSFSDLYQELSRHLPRLQKSRLETELQLYQTMEDLTNCQAFDDVRDGILTLDQRSLKEALSACDLSVIESLGLQNVAISLRSEDNARILSPLQSNGVSNPHATSSTPSSKRGKPNKAAKSSAKSSKQEAKSTTPIAEELVSTLDRKLRVSSLDISSLLLHEAYILSSRAIRFKQNFDVQPRAVLERALLKPGDYLTCDCCSDYQHDGRNFGEPGQDEVTSQGGVVRDSMPAACMLFSLLQEAPTIINVRDLFDAFSSRVDKIANENGANNEEEAARYSNTMTLFYRAMAELKMIGLVKASAGTQVKKRTAGGRANKNTAQDVDFIAKTSWAGS